MQAFVRMQGALFAEDTLPFVEKRPLIEMSDRFFGFTPTISEVQTNASRF